MNNEVQSRKWLITINNPINYGMTHENIKEILKTITPIVYYCMSDEIGEEGTFHTHIYIACKSAYRFSSLLKKFTWDSLDENGEKIKDKEGNNKQGHPHLDVAKGTSQQNKEYVFKEGKWLNDKKNDTNIKESHEEEGELPMERQGQRNDINDLYDMIKIGMSNYEIIEENPSYILQMDKIDKVRQTIKEESFKNIFRKLEVTYVNGKSGTNKTRDIMEKYGYDKVYRITDNKHPFDNYKGEDVIVFEEFYGSNFRINDMLNYLDGYPLQLPCRYNNKIACFTKVYMTSNINLIEQYENVQQEHKETWKAFLRRINYIEIYRAKGIKEVIDFTDKDMIPVLEKVILREELKEVATEKIEQLKIIK